MGKGFLVGAVVGLCLAAISAFFTHYGAVRSGVEWRYSPITAIWLVAFCALVGTVIAKARAK